MKPNHTVVLALFVSIGGCIILGTLLRLLMRPKKAKKRTLGWTATISLNIKRTRFGSSVGGSANNNINNDEEQQRGSDKAKDKESSAVDTKMEAAQAGPDGARTV
ncbi:hypothetical protein GTA08_BOTSDO08504 [Botryosphaeria dothidea]|uniref:Uncharacterized protein n=1 Tax=Botryosphaeria dothidea TaxID=55169 RepID=A0A8H4IPU0_9PEZI|nr:hypothetical protein GTA08_BOTSDO08504 [Botryosphaeria dothidea]